ncbi:MAG: Arylsulfatase [Firmicutes bacterium ADurb.Bin193]|nr:MAG: Arylsulfatase [Firmicutes bacterium ADurb.Bin193]
MKKPHIIIFNPDQFRLDAMGHMGNKAAVTPNFDKMATEDGVSFRFAFCQNPVCTPSRCSFMSGWYPHVRGHRTMAHMMQPDEPVLLKTLKDEGYYVWWGGKNDLIPGQNNIYDYCNFYNIQTNKDLMPNLHTVYEWRGEKDGPNYYSFYAGKLDTKGREVYYDSDWDHIMSAVEFIKNAPEDQPVCIYLPILYPHPPYAVEDPWYSMINRDDIEEIYPRFKDSDKKPSMLKGIIEKQRLKGWTPQQWKELRATYHGMCARVDYQFGLVVNALKEKGMYDDSAIFVFSDHGDYTGDYGIVEKTQNTFEDDLTNVPFIIKPPKWVDVKPGIREALVELIDFPATVEDLTGIKPKHTHFGRSLLPLITGEKDEHRDAVFCEGGRLHGEEHCKEKEGPARYPTNEVSLYWTRIQWQVADGPEHGKGVMIRTKDYKYVHRLYESDELYDLKADPMELHNRIDDESLSGVLAELKNRLMRFYLETNDVVPFRIDAREPKIVR